mgnify:FL=1
MARVDTLTTNFSAGEWSPRLYGRPDIAKYADALKRGRDVVCLQHGGFRSRPGTEDLGAVKEQSKRTRLIPFVYSATDAYVLELGDTYMRVWREGALVGGPYELTTPYATADLLSVDYTQGADTMFLFLQTKPIYRLRRFSSTNWVLDVAPLDPGPFGEIGRRQSTAITLGSASAGATTATSGSAAFLNSDVGRFITYQGGLLRVTLVTGATTADVTVTSAFPSTTLPSGSWVMAGSPKTGCTPSAAGPVGATITLTLDAAGWRSTDVGAHVQINGGLARITSYSSGTAVSAVVLSELSGTTKAELESWSVEYPVWNASDGYPATGTLHQQRLVAAGTATMPQTIWGSRPGLYLDFTKGAADDDSYSFELASDEINPVRFLSSNRDLLALTYGGEWTLSGGIEKPITPTNVRATPQAKVGCASVRPEQIDDELYYVQRGVSVLRTVSWSPQVGGYLSGEASTMAEHLAKGGIGCITYQQSPERIAWCYKDDGSYIAMTVSREQNIRALTLCTPAGGGVVESTATIPEDGEDRTYMIVRRTVDGVTTRRVERMSWTAYLDGQTEFEPAPGDLVVTGADRFEGMTVGVLADGIDIGDFEVSGGEFTLSREASTVVYGLRFVPTGKLLPSETGTGMGASAGRTRMQGRCMVLLNETVGCSVNGQALAFREYDAENVLDSPVQPFSGWKDVSEFGWSPDADEIEITQPQAYPMHVLAVVRRITSNPG